MKIEFTKMHGIGNDYIYVNCMERELPDPSGAAVAMSPRHFSVGADGLVMICSSSKADARMRMFNADGSEGLMCGNAIRCVGKYLYDNGIVKKKRLSVETASGIKHLTLFTGEDGTVVEVSVDMGYAVFAPDSIPVVYGGEMINEPCTVDGHEWEMTAVSMGNPHCVIYVEEPDALELEKIGPSFENNPIFPERVNTEFVRVIDRSTLKMRVWERGSGETWACGTGACAVCASSVKNGLCDPETPINVELVGGQLTVTVSKDYRITMKGKAEKVYDGIYDYR